MTTDPVTITRITHADARFASLIFPRWRSLFAPNAGPADAALPQGYLAFAAQAGGQAVGLALAWLAPGADIARLCSIYVLPAFRRHGIAHTLLARTEAAVQADGAAMLAALHTDSMPACAAFEALLQRSGWPAPELSRVRLSGRADWALSAERDWQGWLARLVARGWAATRWDALDASGLAELDRVVAAAPELMRPLPDRRYEPGSMVLRCHDAIVGWIQGVQEIRAGHILYPVGYVIPEFQRTPWLVAGLVAACRRQMDDLGPDSIAHYETAADNFAMQSIMHKRLSGRPGVFNIDRQFESLKPLQCA